MQAVAKENWRGKSQRDTKATFTEKAKNTHKNFYNYDLVVYVNSLTNIEVVCPKHGVFSIAPNNHIAGKGCKLCFSERRHLVRLKSESTFTEQAYIKHSGKYSYSWVQYKGAKTKVEITCPLHSSFWQTPDNHLQGQGCPSCIKSGYSTGKAGYLYILSDNFITKVGITNRSPQQRAKDVFKSGGPELEVVASYFFKDGIIPRNLELACHKYLNLSYRPVSAIFDGSTECFLNVDISALLAFITPLASSNPEIV